MAGSPLGRDKRGPSRRGIAIGPLDFSAAKMAAFPVSDCGRDHLRERPRLSRPGWGEPSAGAAALVAADGGASPQRERPRLSRPAVGRALRASRTGELGRDKRGPSRRSPPLSFYVNRFGCKVRGKINPFEFGIFVIALRPSENLCMMRHSRHWCCSNVKPNGNN